MGRKGQGFTEYALLAGISIIALVLTVNSFLKGSVKNSFTSHFDTAKSRIVGE